LPACEAVLLLTEPAVIDKILEHRMQHGLTSPLEVNTAPRASLDDPPV